MAEAFFNDTTGRRHRGVSAGTQPEEAVNPVAVKAMAEVGIDMGGVRQAAHGGDGGGSRPGDDHGVW